MPTEQKPTEPESLFFPDDSGDGGAGFEGSPWSAPTLLAMDGEDRVLFVTLDASKLRKLAAWAAAHADNLDGGGASYG